MCFCRLPHALQEEGPNSPAAAELARLEEEQVQLKSLLRDDSFLLHSKFHPDWGQLFKSGYQDSRFATQVNICRFLCFSRCCLCHFREVKPRPPGSVV